MQTIGFIKHTKGKMKVLLRPNINGGYVSIKKRLSGKDGQYLEDESIYLSLNSHLVEKLENGEVVKI